MWAQLWPEGLRDWQQSEALCYTAKVQQSKHVSQKREALCYTTKVQQSKHVSQARARLSAAPPGFSKANTSLKTEGGSLLHHQGSAKQTCLSKQREALWYTAKVQQSKHVSQARARLSAAPPGFSKANTSLKTEGGSLLQRQGSSKQTCLSKKSESL